MSHCHCSDPLYPVDAQAVRKNLSNRDAIISPCQTKTEREYTHQRAEQLEAFPVGFVSNQQ